MVLIREPGGGYLQASKFVHHVIDIGSFPLEPTRFFNRIADRFPPESKPVLLYPIGDREIKWVIDHLALVPDHIKLVMVDPEVFKTCSSKTALYSRAAENGVPCLTNVSVKEVDGIVAAAGKIGFPCILKADNESKSILGDKVALVKSRSRMESLVKKLSASKNGSGGGAIPFIIQAYSSGNRYNVYFFAQKGVLLGASHIKILRTDQYNDTGLAVQGCSVEPNHKLSEYTQKLVWELQYDGVGCAQFLVEEEAERITFLEINARLGANFAAVYHCGLDLPLLAVRLARGEVIERQPAPRTGKHFAWFYGDVLGLFRSVLKRRLSLAQFRNWASALLNAQLRADHHVTWDYRDPLPTFRLWIDRLIPGQEKPSL